MAFDASEWMLLQLSDSALPTGGFVSSSGLEAAVQAGCCNDTQALSLFISTSLDNLAHSTFWYLDQIYGCLVSSPDECQSKGQEEGQSRGLSETYHEASQIKRLVAIDAIYDSYIQSNHVACRASIAQGIAYLSLVLKSFPDCLVSESPLGSAINGRSSKFSESCDGVKKQSHLSDSNANGPAHITEFNNNYSSTNISPNSKFNGNRTSIISSFKHQIMTLKSPGHLPICFAIACRVLGIQQSKLHSLFMFLHVKNITSAAVRLNLIGPYQGQMLIYQMQPQIERILGYKKRQWGNEESALERKWRLEDGEEETGICQTAPLIDVIQGCHDLLYSRLFNS